MLSGRMPFTNSDTMEIVRDLVDWKSPVKSLLREARVSSAVGALVEKMAAGRPEKRYQSAEEVIREIDRIVEKHSLKVENLDLEPSEDRPGPRRLKH
jgi:hypothetical protein